MKNKKPVSVYEQKGLKVVNYGDAAELILHGEIIDDTDAEWLKLCDDDLIGYCYPAKVRDALDGLAGLPVDVHIASDGGNVAAGFAIYNMLVAHKMRYKVAVNVYIDAWAASIASYIAMAGDKIYMPTNGFIMIHNPLGGAFGDSQYLRAVADWLEKLRNELAKTYASRAAEGKTVDDFLAAMDAETWYTAQEAADTFKDVEIIDDANRLEAVACFSGLKTAPEAITQAHAEAEAARLEAEKAEAEAKRVADIKAAVQAVLERSVTE